MKQKYIIPLILILGIGVTGCTQQNSSKADPHLREDATVQILSTEKINDKTLIQLELTQPAGGNYALQVTPTVMFDEKNVISCMAGADDWMKLIDTSHPEEILASEKSQNMGDNWKHANMRSYYHRSTRENRLCIEIVWIPAADLFSQTDRRSKIYDIRWKDLNSQPEISQQTTGIGDRALPIDMPNYENEVLKRCTPNFCPDYPDFCQ